MRLTLGLAALALVGCGSGSTIDSPEAARHKASHLRDGDALGEDGVEEDDDERVQKKKSKKADDEQDEQNDDEDQKDDVQAKAVVKAKKRKGMLATGAGKDGGPHAKLYDGASNNESKSVMAYDQTFRGGVRVAVGDIDNDGTPDLITGAGEGGGPHVKVISGASGAEIRSFMAYDQGFRGGVYVASGDVDGDGVADIITGAGETGGPHVKVFSGASQQELMSFFAYDQALRIGVRVGAADLDGDGKFEVLTGAGNGGGPHVKAFNLSGQEVRSFMAYDQGFRGGVFVAGGDVNGDGKDDIITGAGVGGGPHVRVFDGVSQGEIASFFAYDQAFRGGCTVGATDVDGDGKLEIITGAGYGGGPHVKVFGANGTQELRSFFAYDQAFRGGVYVAGH